MRLVTLLLLLVVQVACSHYQDQFDDFLVQYNRKYQSKEEYYHRLSIFEQNMIKAENLNKINEGSATFGVNKFADWSPEEFASQYLMSQKALELSSGVKRIPSGAPVPRPISSSLQCSPNAVSYTWQKCGSVVGPVRNQGQCGACWAFSAVEAIEAYAVLSGFVYEPFSVQQLVDCSDNNGDQGCSGGYPVAGLLYVQEAGGIETEASYPYTGEVDTCQFEQNRTVCQVNGHRTLTGENEIYKQLSSSAGGPVSVTVDATTWQSYTGGIMTNCPAGDVTHALEVVGYANWGEKNSYWILRNQWGTDWGIQGYIWLQTGENLCNIDNDPIVPLVSCDGTSTTTGLTGTTADVTGDYTATSTGEVTTGEWTTGEVTTGEWTTGEVTTGKFCPVGCCPCRELMTPISPFRKHYGFSEYEYQIDDVRKSQQGISYTLFAIIFGAGFMSGLVFLILAIIIRNRHQA